MQALGEHLGLPNEPLYDLLDLVTVSIAADIVPITGENRVLASYGLRRFNEDDHLLRPGLAALRELATLREGSLGISSLIFGFAPRINAAGRMGNAEQGLRLLLARDQEEADTIARSLEEDNLQRRKHDERVLEEAIRKVHDEVGYPDCSSILLWSDTWHPGVIGIVASRLVERFQRPTVLVAIDGDRGRGSGRSLPGLDLDRKSVV